MASVEKSYQVPCMIAVSRATGEICRVDACEATEKEFRQMCCWILRAHGYDRIADEIREHDLRKAAG